MTASEEELVRKLREFGLGYKAISSRTGISVGTVRHFINTEGIQIQERPIGYCRNCSRPISQDPRRKFCSRACGLIWWHEHSDLLNRKAFYTFICPACNTTFTVYGNKKRKYCSHSCYIKARFKPKAQSKTQNPKEKSYEIY